MVEANYLAIVVAAVAAFIAGALYSSALFGNAIMKMQDPNWKPGKSEPPPAWKMTLEFARCLAVAAVLAYFVVQLDVSGWASAFGLGALVWAGFPAMILTGAVLWENEPVKLAAIHAGDWLVKLLIIAVILGVWQ